MLFIPELQFLNLYSLNFTVVESVNRQTHIWSVLLPPLKNILSLTKPLFPLADAERINGIQEASVS